MHKISWFSFSSVFLGFAFLYIPILLVVIYSFNESKLVTVWGGFSFKWYVELFNNQGLRDAAWVTLKVASISATLATILAVIASVMIVRVKRLFGRTLFLGMVMTPLVMPEVVTGLSLLMLFVAIDFDRGLTTVIIAHTTFGIAFATVVISSRLVDFDKSVEEAAIDLGCSQISAFFKVTLPIILPAVLAAWLLAFTLSLDDVVIASFTNGPGATTLSIKVFSQIRLGVKPDINALCTIFILLVTTGVVIASLVTKRKSLP